jgi:glyoxylase-like metal-dependent hydrolase (beta-lactamase superfamily II)/ferredoxin
MALVGLRIADNVPGDFYVDSTCIDCDLCRQIAPSVFGQAGDQSAVFRQPTSPDEQFAAMKALVTCPTASIGTTTRRSAKVAAAAYPERISDDVYFCGFASKNSYGASSYLIVRSRGNVLVDSPRFADPLARRIAQLGGIRWMFLTHRDDVADHAKWAERFGATRVMHRDDMSTATSSVEHVLDGPDSVLLEEDLEAIPTPGHTRGHTVLLYQNRYLFSGDHVWWSDERGSLSASRGVCWYSWAEQIRSMERLLNHEFEFVLPGHGRRTHATSTAMRSYLEECISRMKACVTRSAGL